MPRITGASVWEQELYDYICDHVETEGAMLREYQRLAEDPTIAIVDTRARPIISADAVAAVRRGLRTEFCPAS